MPTEEVQKLRDVFATEGPRSAITYLNSLTSHRFTSAFRFDDGMLKSTFFYDRDNPGNSGCEEIPILASYCVFVRDFKIMFKTEDALRDARLNVHPKQKTIQSYCGVPLVDANGKVFGTACHFDFKPGSISRVEVELLEALGDLLGKAA
jgi:GAF domain-containing protein